MTDDNADTPAADAEDHVDAGDADEDQPSSNPMSTPGGGPQRVVSNKGVDDILESLNSGPAAGAKAESETETESGTETKTKTKAETKTTAGETGETDTEEETTPADGPTDTDTDAADSATETSSEPTHERTGTSSESASTSASASEALSAIRNRDGQESTDRETGQNRSNTAASEPSTTELSFDESAVDGLEDASADTEDDATLDPDDLADRIDSNTVTGADVRAAEAGEGREKTPEVDEIELSMDDLEQTRSSTRASSSKSAGESGDGPLAGTIGPDGTDAETGDSDGRRNGEVGDESDADEPTPSSDSESDADSRESGLLGRVRSLFSR